MTAIWWKILNLLNPGTPSYHILAAEYNHVSNCGLIQEESYQLLEGHNFIPVDGV